jgi:hypothetical protein
MESAGFHGLTVGLPFQGEGHALSRSHAIALVSEPSQPLSQVPPVVSQPAPAVSPMPRALSPVSRASPRPTDGVGKAGRAVGGTGRPSAALGRLRCPRRQALAGSLRAGASPFNLQSEIRNLKSNALPASPGARRITPRRCLALQSAI